MTDDAIESKATASSLKPYYMGRGDGGRLIITDDQAELGIVLSGPRDAASWKEAQELYRSEFQQFLQQEEEQGELSEHVEPVFGSGHEALTFAFRFAGNQSPRTPMTTLAGGSALGSGRGLSGLDGAGQAGMVLQALRHLGPSQRHLVVARYGDVRDTCPCCGQLAPTQQWLEAVEHLSLCDELKDLPKKVRHAAIEKVVCRRKLRFADYAVEFGLSQVTLRRRLREVKIRMAKLEKDAVGWLDDYFKARGMVRTA
jgi:hypothetical protein